MGYRCIVEGCRNFLFKTRTNSKSVKYHPFPKNDEMRSKWIKALRRSDCDDWVPDHSSYVCSEHFQPTDFERDLKAELLHLPPKKILKPEAVPSLNLMRSREETNQPIRWRKPIKDLSCENKENITAVDSNVPPCNGFIISYLGVPRLFITASGSKTVDGSTVLPGNGNQSRIIPLDSYHNGGIKPTSAVNPNFIQLETSNPKLSKNVFRLDELCRLCGSYSNRMTPIFDNTKCNFFEVIENHFPEIKIRRDDILPVQICFKCDSTLVSWYQFYKTCNSVNRRFQSIVKKLEPEKEEKPNLETLRDNTQSSRIENENMNFEEFGVPCHDGSDMPEIEIVEVSPETLDTDTLESVWIEEKHDATRKEEKIEPIVVEEKFNPIDVEQKIEPAEIEQRFDPNLYTKALLEEQGTNVSDCESILVSDSSHETTQSSSSSFRIQKDIKKAGTMRRGRRRRRIPSLNLRRMCHICGKIFKYPESLRRHLKTVHSDERPFKCHLCTSSFNRNHNLTIHIKVVHQRQRVYVKKHVPRLCDYCGKVLLSARSLEEHISSIHTKKALYECEKCHSTFYRKLTFDKHRQSDECDDKNPKKCNAPKVEDVFLKYCDICGLEFKKEHFYLKHKFKHMNSFTCAVCSMKFEDGTMLKDHVNSEHPEVKPFECEVCGKKFKNKPLLNCHLVIHNGEKRYQCQYCSLKFLKKKYLSTHILTHTGERPFVCTICGKGFKQSGDMRKHKATHIRKQI